jgi:hypothetical protein
MVGYYLSLSKDRLFRAVTASAPSYVTERSRLEEPCTATLWAGQVCFDVATACTLERVGSTYRSIPVLLFAGWAG